MKACTRDAGRGARALRFLGLLAALGIVAPSLAQADWWEENFEVHGFLTSKLYVRSPDLEFGNESKISSWRTELNLEPELRIYSGRDFSMSFYGVFRPVYDAVYEIHPKTFGGDRVQGGKFGSGAVDLLVGGVDVSKDVIRGKRFPLCGGGVEGEFCLNNSDTGSLFVPDSGGLSTPSATAFLAPGGVDTALALINATKLIPTKTIDDTVFFGRVTAPVGTHTTDTPRIAGTALTGGNATGETYLSFLNSTARVLGGFDANLAALGAAGAAGAVDAGSAALEASLTPVGQVGPIYGLAGLASMPLATPLNFYAKALGSRRSLNEQAPVDINRRESELKTDCFDNAHPWCFVRESYFDFEFGNTFVRLGKQQVVWGKTDAFRLQDNIMPIDIGYHNVFPPLEERRIPQLALDVIHTVGDVGPFQDFSVEFVWLFDRFRPLQFGQCGEPYDFAAACETRADAGGHSLFNFSLARVENVDWTLANTEPGLRLEFRLPDPSIAFSLSAFWSHQDLPVVEFKNLYSASNPNAAVLLLLQGLGLGPTIEALAGAAPGSTPWSTGFDPFARNPDGTPAGTLAAANTTLLTAWGTAFNAVPPAGGGCAGVVGRSALGECANAFLFFGLPWSASEAVLKYPRVLTLGGSMDYQVPGSDTILRLEVAYDVDRGITNTAKPNAVDSSDVFLAAIGLDRPTYIPFLNRNRTAFISVQTFVEHVIDYDDGLGIGDGMIVDETQLISTIFMQNYWRNDSIILTNFAAYDWNAAALITGPSLRWVVNQNLFFDLGVNLLFGKQGTAREHNIRDICPGTKDLSCLGDPTTWNAGNWTILNKNMDRKAFSPFFGTQSFADLFMEDRDEVWVGFTYQW